MFIIFKFALKNLLVENKIKYKWSTDDYLFLFAL